MQGALLLYISGGSEPYNATFLHLQRIHEYTIPAILNP